MNDNIVAVIEKIELSHQAIAKTISDFGGELRDLGKDVKKYNNKLDELNGRFNGLEAKVDDLAPVLKQYNDNKEFEKRAAKMGKTAVLWAVGIVAIGTAIIKLKEWIIYLFR